MAKNEIEMDEEEIIERLNKFLEKQGLDIQGKYFITKKMNEEYWEEIQGEDEGVVEGDDILGELGEEEPELTEQEEPEEEIAAPTPEKKTTKKKITIRKPKVTTKKPEPEETKEEKPEDVTI